MPIKQIVGIPGVPGAVGIWDDDPDAISAHAALTSGPHDLGATWFSKYIIRGKARSGIPAGQACWFAEDFTDIARWQKTTGTADMVAVTTLPGGVGELAVAAGDSVAYRNGDATLGAPTVCLGDGRWYMAGRLAILAVPADGAVAVGLNGAGGNVAYMGALSMLEPVKFVAMLNGSVGLELIISSVSIDTGWHDFEAWCDGSTYYLAVDGETPVSYVSAGPPTGGLRVEIGCSAGGALGSTLQIDKLLYVFPQAA